MYATQMKAEKGKEGRGTEEKRNKTAGKLTRGKNSGKREKGNMK